MLRITKILEDEKTVRLRLDGRLDGSTLADLEAIILQSKNGRTKLITLDLAGVVFIDEASVKLLRKMKDQISIVNASLFVKTLIGDVLDDRID